MANKKTQRDYYNEIIAVLAKADDTEELIQFCENRIEALNKKSASRKPTKAQVENEEIKAEILATLSSSEGMTITAIQKANPVLAKYSNQKISALVRLMEKDDNTVRKVTEGKTTLVYLV